MIEFWQQCRICDYLIDFGIAFADPAVKLEGRNWIGKDEGVEEGCNETWHF